MQVGNTIKQLRTQKGLTQKDLADRLFMSAQAVSRWENNETEPDINAIKKLAEIFEVGVEVIINGFPVDETSESAGEESTQVPAEENKTGEEVVTPVAVPETNNHVIGRCHICNKEILDTEDCAKKEISNKDGHKTYQYTCSTCFANQSVQTKEETKKKITAKKYSPGRADKKLIVWSIVAGVLAFIISLIVCIYNYDKVGIGWTIGIPLIAGYGFVAEVYCIFSDSWIATVFGTIASWSIRFPGIIFTWDLEGIAFLIVMKILFAILGAIFGICVFLLAVSVSMFFSMFTFVPLLFYNKNNYEGIV